MACAIVKWRSISHKLLPGAFVLLLLFTLEACSDVTMRQKADQSKNHLDHLLTNAQNIGVPQTQLATIREQEARISRTSAPMTLFSNQTSTYYRNLDIRYQNLAVQVSGLEYQSTQQLEFQASQDLQNFEILLSKRQSQGFSATQNFADQLTRNQQLLNQARTPRDYLQISANAQNAIQALNLMGPAYDNLANLQQAVGQLASARLNTTPLNLQVQNDYITLQQAATAQAYHRLLDTINAQLQETRVISTQALPYVVRTKLQQLSANVEQAQTYGVDVSTSQQHVQTESVNINRARNLHDYLKISSQLDSDLAELQFPLLQGQANQLLKQYHQEVKKWGGSHQYVNPYNQHSYRLDYEYDQAGIGAEADAMVHAAQTRDDYQAAITFLQNETENLRAMEANFKDGTPANRSHATDTHLMSYYRVSGTVVVVSLLEQTMRVYQDGKLLKAMPVTTGQYERPTPPGNWQMFARESPTIFKSSEPKGSAFWYPNTQINYAMGFRDGGYYIHDSSWRNDYGLHTNFPHTDSGGNQDFAYNGSHGCINVSSSDAAWIYQHTAYGTSVIIY